MELAIILIAFTTMLLGLIFTFGLEIANNKMLLDAKFSTEMYAASEGDKALAGGSEIKSWSYSKVNGAQIPFLLSDEKVGSASSTVDESYESMKQRADSRTTKYNFTWTSPRDFNESTVSSDFVNDPFSDAFSAAELVSRTADTDTVNPLLARDQGNLDVLTEAFRRWFGISLNKNTLEKNITNRVYLPVYGEK